MLGYDGANGARPLEEAMHRSEAKLEQHEQQLRHQTAVLNHLLDRENITQEQVLGLASYVGQLSGQVLQFGSMVKVTNLPVPAAVSGAAAAPTAAQPGVH